MALATHLVETFGPIFPLNAELKDPWCPNGHLDATADLKQIERWVREKPNCNWGGCINSVVDVDTSEAHGKDGLGNWLILLMENNDGNEPETLRLKTPTGGLHYPLTTKHPKKDLRPGVELPNYIVMPGSHVTANGKSVKTTGFYKPDNNLPINGVPFIGKLIESKKVESAANDNGAPASDIDCDAAITQATAMLKDFARSKVMRDKNGVQYNGAAIEGDYGDNWTVQVAMKVGDLGVSCETCLELMDEHFNCACVPPWSFDGRQSLRTKVESAYKSRQSAIGAGSAQADFEDDPVDDVELEPEAVAPKPKLILSATPFKRIDPKSIPPRDWLFLRHYIRKFCVADISPGGGGKSTNVIAESLAMVTRTDLFNFGWMYPRPLKVWYWNGEDPKEEIDRRFAAAIKFYSEPGEDWEGAPPLDAAALALLDDGKYLFTDNGRNTPIKIATEVGKNGMQMAIPLVDALIDESRARGIDVLIIDPFVASHSISENDNTKIDRVIKEGWNLVCERADLCTDLIHHTRKVAKGVDHTAADARGASAIVDAARDVRVYNTMSAETAEKLHIPETDRWRYIRIDSDKPNMARRNGGVSPWRFLASVSLNNGRDGMQADDVGVGAPWSPPEADPIADETRNEKIIEAALALFKEGKRITKMHGNNAIKKVVPQFQRLTGIEDLNAADIKAAFDSVEDRTWKYRDSVPGQRSGTAGYYPIAD